MKSWLFSQCFLCSIGIKTCQLRSFFFLLNLSPVQCGQCSGAWGKSLGSRCARDGDAKMFMLWQARLFTAHARNARVVLPKTRTWWHYWNADISTDNGIDFCILVSIYACFFYFGQIRACTSVSIGVNREWGLSVHVSTCQRDL